MKMLSSLGSLIAALVLCALAQSAEATVACGVVNSGYNGSSALQISTLSVPRDAPVGTVLYQQNFNQAGSGNVLQCYYNAAGPVTGPVTGPIPVTSHVALQGNGSNTGYSGGTYGSNIFATGVAGIGVAWFNGTSVINTTGVTTTDPNGCTLGIPGTLAGDCRTAGLKFTSPTGFVLIKTAAVVGTGTINGTALGSMSDLVTVSGSTSYVANSVKMSGSINIVALTCQTPTVNVPMGTYQAALLTGIGSATAQVNFSIALTGCPGFSGLYSNSGSAPTNSEAGKTSAGTSVPNTISLRVDPVTTPIDAPNGVLSLTAGGGPGGITATGVGLQLLDASGAPWALSQNQLLNLSLSSSNTTLNIPLSARYLQTAAQVTPGTANAVATYTIIYQ